MDIISDQVMALYKYNNKFYRVSERKSFEINDIVFDGRDYMFKRIASNDDIFDMSFVAPELYIILEEVKENI